MSVGGKESQAGRGFVIRGLLVPATSVTIVP